MSNKIIAIVALLTVWVPAGLGFIEELSGVVLLNDVLLALIGIPMLVFVTWASVRLLKVPDVVDTPALPTQQ